MKNNYAYAKQQVFQILNSKLLVCGTERPFYKQKQKIILQNWSTGFFKIYCFLLFEKK